MKNNNFISVFRHYLNSYVERCQALGYKYKSEIYILKRFDCFSKDRAMKPVITKSLFDAWSYPKTYHKARTTIMHHNIIRAFAIYINGVDRCSYIPPRCMMKSNYDFSPYIFTKIEFEKILAQAKNIELNNISPFRHIVVPALLRMLYCCGFRINEVLCLKVKDIDWDDGVAFVNSGKNEIDRLVPMNKQLLKYLKDYIAEMPHPFNNDDWLFPSRNGNHYSHSAVYSIFRELLFSSGISHGGRGKGPRLHDFRHTFAVNCLATLIDSNMDTMQILPILAAYLGHKNYKATCRYLHLTAEVYPSIVKKTEFKYETLIPSFGGDGE
jgi:integrase/recombinase XerD